VPRLCDGVEQAIELGVVQAVDIVAQLMQHGANDEVVVNEGL
jgi:hypothetical protein